MAEEDEESLPGWAEDVVTEEPTVVVRYTRRILICCAVALILALFRSGPAGTASARVFKLAEFAVGKDLGEARLYDEVTVAALEHLKHDTVVIFKAYMLSKAKLDRLYRHLFYILDSTSNYHFCVLLDNTKGLAQSRRIEADPRFKLVDKRRFHMFNYTLYDVIGEFPEMIYYLYQLSYEDEHSTTPVRGSCCGREDMWQMLRAPIILWQNKKRLRFRYTWMIEDDFEALRAGDPMLMRFVLDLDKRYAEKNIDVLGFRQVPCPTFWHKMRRTPKFIDIIERNDAKKLPWFCVADYAQRLSQEYLQEHEKALRNFVFGFGETMVYPLALDRGLSVELYSGFKWLGFRKKPLAFFYNMSVDNPEEVILAHIQE